MHKATLRSYITGFLLSLTLTSLAYIFVTENVNSYGRSFPAESLIPLVLGLAATQFIIQLIFFLHLGKEKKPWFNLIAFSLTIGVVLVVILASIWIMDHLNANMSASPTQMENYMQMQSDGGGF